MWQYDKPLLEYVKLLPWYAAFSNRDLLEIEDLREDLLYYFKDWYGYGINWQQIKKKE